jgi:hypothetical protein
MALIGSYEASSTIASADHRALLRVINRQRAVARRGNAPARHVDGSGIERDAHFRAFELDPPHRIAHRRDMPGRIEARAFDVEPAEHFFRPRRQTGAKTSRRQIIVQAGFRHPPAEEILQHPLAGTSGRHPWP